MHQIRPHPARVDVVSGLPGGSDARRWLQAQTLESAGDWVVLLGLDGEHGGQVGKGGQGPDAMLRPLAEAATHECERDATVARWAEGVLLIVSRGAAHEGWMFAERVRERLARMEERGARAVTVSAGVAGGGGGAGEGTLTDRVAQGERALELARARGGDGVCTFEAALLEDLCGRLALEAGATIESRRQSLLRGFETHLGPTQIEHLTVHCEIVAGWSSRIAARLGVGPKAARQIGLGALLHDLGKAAIPEVILAKPAALTTEERRVVDAHAALGAMLAQRIGAEPEITSMVMLHHARFDEPEGSSQDLLAPHVISVADALATMTSDRPYRAAMTGEEAARELGRCSGAQFNPVVTRAALDLLSSGARLAA